MPVTVVLVVGLDSWLLATHAAVWRSAGYIVIPSTIREAIDHFRSGDFDLVLLGDSIPPESRERLTGLIRASGSKTPVVCVAKQSSECDPFADATIENDSAAILAGMGHLLAAKAKTRPKPPILASARS